MKVAAHAANAVVPDPESFSLFPHNSLSRRNQPELDVSDLEVVSLCYFYVITLTLSFSLKFLLLRRYQQSRMRAHLQPKKRNQKNQHPRLHLLPNPCIYQTRHPYLLWPLHYRLNVRARLLHRAAQHIQTLRLMMMVLHRFNHVFDDSFLMGLFTLCV